MNDIEPTTPGDMLAVAAIVIITIFLLLYGGCHG